MSDVIIMAVGIVPSVIVGIIMLSIESRRRRHEKAVEKRAEERKREALLALDLQFAAAKMSLAAAVAVRDGHCNGELKDAIETYEPAKARYLQFLNEQAVEHRLQEA